MFYLAHQHNIEKEHSSNPLFFVQPIFAEEKRKGLMDWVHSDWIRLDSTSC